jgi:hypothetical protein
MEGKEGMGVEDNSRSEEFQQRDVLKYVFC